MDCRVQFNLAWYNLRMKRKGNEYGQTPQYEEGDKVRVWPIFKNPIGTIKEVVDADSFPIKYLVHYQYFKGGTYTEVFDECDLTLFERGQWNHSKCNCQTITDNHATWCNVVYNKGRW